MEEDRRSFLIGTFLAAAAAIDPLAVARAASDPPPNTVPDLMKGLNKGSPKPQPLVILQEDAPKILIVPKSANEFQAFRAGPENTPESPLPDGVYQFGPAGKIDVKNGLISSSAIDPNAIKIEWSEFTKISAMTAPNFSVKDNTAAVGTYSLSTQNSQ